MSAANDNLNLSVLLKSNTSSNADKIPLLKRLNNYGLNGTKRGIRGREVGELVRGFTNLLELIPDKGI
jgi:hypothetical protein